MRTQHDSIRPALDASAWPVAENDPWALTPEQRRALRDQMHASQSDWLDRLARLTEPPQIDDSFPAFLLATPPFDGLRKSIGDATDRTDLDTAAADMLQRFVDRYRDYLA